MVLMMEVVMLVVFPGFAAVVTGILAWHFMQSRMEVKLAEQRADLAEQERSFQVMALCNDLEGPVDQALWEYARAQLDCDPQEIVDKAERLAEELFSSETKFMVTSNKLEGQSIQFLKGAPEIVLEMCNAYPEEKARILAQVDIWAGEGLRLLGLDRLAADTVARLTRLAHWGSWSSWRLTSAGKLAAGTLWLTCRARR